MIRHSVVTARTVIRSSRPYSCSLSASRPPAAAEPATPVSYPGAATATRLTGYAFDRCDAPSAGDDEGLGRLAGTAASPSTSAG